MAFERTAGLAILAVLPTVAAASSGASLPLAPHQAIYELKLAAPTDEILGAEGRIAMELTRKTCDVFDLDYRFMARFEEDGESTLTDQRTVSAENAAGTEFRFSTETFVDGVADKGISGKATHTGDATTVTMERPQARSFTLPASLFPLAHTRELIDKGMAGQRILEARLFDGDDDAERLLTVTAIISPNESPPSPAVAKDETDTADRATSELRQRVAAQLAGTRSWRISEAYYNSDSDPDGMPVFQTSYVLYENGVSDELKLDFGNYVLAGSLAKLELFDPAACTK